MIAKDSEILNTTDIHSVNVEKRNIKPVSKTITSYSSSDVFYNESEIETGYTEKVAIKESKRCLDCGLICYKKSAS